MKKFNATMLITVFLLTSFMLSNIACGMAKKVEHAKLCVNSMKQIYGAIELFTMEDSSGKKEVTIDALLKGGLIKSDTVCPDNKNGTYTIEKSYDSKSKRDIYKVICPKHGDIEKAMAFVRKNGK